MRSALLAKRLLDGPLTVEEGVAMLGNINNLRAQICYLRRAGWVIETERYRSPADRRRGASAYILHEAAQAQSLERAA